ncbi:hypothetical protein QN412_13735 [Pseudomonas sp. RTB3]|uniref:hypothetical protein n=1 Tax=unclassified Pseudomonas TaxID=196821 RepID=UPI002B236068|nr:MULTISPECIES: hypothetical protein [unclassified Pseudomonas]MEB0007891.1 hypothetical protein [Pseudomonas sp. RTB2]MEB0018005.1 hypothetical protein [Pseudomonas sp. RTB3]MEB0270197.1 hypothetical protein [Pseudomonas sp. 5B4]
MRLTAGVLALLFIPLSFVGLLMGGWIGIIVPVGFVYVIWTLAVSFPKVLRKLSARGTESDRVWQLI